MDNCQVFDSIPNQIEVLVEEIHSTSVVAAYQVVSVGTGNERQTIRKMSQSKWIEKLT